MIKIHLFRCSDPSVLLDLRYSGEPSSNRALSALVPSARHRDEKPTVADSTDSDSQTVHSITTSASERVRTSTLALFTAPPVTNPKPLHSLGTDVGGAGISSATAGTLPLSHLSELPALPELTVGDQDTEAPPPAPRRDSVPVDNGLDYRYDDENAVSITDVTDREAAVIGGEEREREDGVDEEEEEKKGQAVPRSSLMVATPLTLMMNAGTRPRARWEKEQEEAEEGGSLHSGGSVGGARGRRVDVTLPNGKADLPQQGTTVEPVLVNNNDMAANGEEDGSVMSDLMQSINAVRQGLRPKAVADRRPPSKNVPPPAPNQTESLMDLLRERMARRNRAISGVIDQGAVSSSVEAVPVGLGARVGRDREDNGSVASSTPSRPLSIPRGLPTNGR